MTYQVSPFVSTQTARQRLRDELQQLVDLAARADVPTIEAKMKRVKGVLGQVKYSEWNEYKN
jgi:hypothetical protein